MRFRTYREYPTAEQARWRIMALWEVGLRPRRVAHLLAIQPAVVYYWQRRFTAFGLPGLTTRTREETAIPTRGSVQAMMDVFQLRDHNPLLGPQRVKMALEALGQRYGHTTVWPRVALYTQAHPHPPQEPRLPNPDARPRQATAPQQGWVVARRSLGQIEGQWLSSILLFEGQSRAIGGPGCDERQNRSRLLQVFRQALPQWGAPREVVRDHAAGCPALAPCLRQLESRWAPITQGPPWQHLADSGCASQRRMLDAYGVGGTERERVDAPQRPLGQAYQFWGHWAHTRRDAQGRVSDRSPEVILGQATGRAIDPVRRRRALRRRQLRRTVRQYGQLRLHNCGLSGEPGWWGQRVAVWVDDDRLRIEQAEPMVVSYPCVDDPRQRRITESDA